MILCDGCDAPSHPLCVGLQVVPEGDWFCSVCEQDKLVKCLEAKLKIIEDHFAALEKAKSQSILKRTNRIADIGANLDNLFGGKSAKKREYDENGLSNEENEDGEQKAKKRRHLLNRYIKLNLLF